MNRWHRLLHVCISATRGAMLCFCLLSFLFVIACQDDHELDIAGIEQFLSQTPQSENPYFTNHPLPLGQKSLRVLAIGNSYTIDALYFVRDILDNLGVDSTSYSLYSIVHEAASLRYWCEQAQSDFVLDTYCWGGARMDVRQGTLAQLLEQAWDVVVLAQYSRDAIDYTTYHPWLHQLTDFVLQHCANPSVTLAWQMAPSYSDKLVTDYSNYERWLLIAQSTKNVMTRDGIDVVIPVGTAVQNARNTSLNSKSQLTCDGWHLNYGVGRYLAACTTVQSLFAPVYSIMVQDDRSQILVPDSLQQTYPPEPVTDENRPICHACVLNAVREPFRVVR